MVGKLKQPIILIILTQKNIPITELITITIATTAYPEKKTGKLPNFLLQTFSLLEMFVLNIYFFSEIVMVMISWKQDFVSSNSVCNHTRDLQIAFMITNRTGLHSVLLPL